MTLPRYFEISKYWEDYPPLHLAFLAQAGHKPKRIDEAQREAKKDSSSMEELMTLFGVDPTKLEVGKGPQNLRPR